MARYPNPWLRQLRIVGYDERGNRRTELLPHQVPDLYFWLGADAYPPPRMVTSISIAKPGTWHEVRWP